MPFFSVIIPLFNKEKHIEATLKSVLNQTFNDFEIIIINDGSTDQSVEKVLPFESKKTTLFHHPQNKGLSASRNTGIKHACSSYIVFLDADDIWKPNYLQKISSLINNFTEARIYATNYLEIYANTIAIKPKLNLKNFKNDGIVADFFESSLSQPIYCPSGLCVEKSVLEKIGFYNEQITFGEDVDFNIRANNLFKLAYSPENLVEYTMFSENKITNSELRNKTITDFDSYESLTQNNRSLKKYLDFNRYIMAKQYKIENDTLNFDKIKKRIDSNPEISGLNYKQRFLLNSPLFLLKIIKKIKIGLLEKGIRITTYD
ncbi:glycosyltransferase family A protein [Flavobacterium sp. K5-23]|uniref:glycosyltransferase family 2 protein n=1 Tax=Flavobacterium sp. K5-23 TaxID=2746225 RepID=UPI00200FD132|nr:glycosyltransferase family A protein [Flavobacterium sp. K5-23]UQD57608.1 glycosyltransferase family 2 protein [Flavobacterium sp. K5-23]